MSDWTRSISSAAWSNRLALFAVGLVLAAGLFHRLFGMSTPLALNLFAVAFLVAGLSILLGVFALVRIWRHGHAGAAAAVAGILIGLLVLSWPLSLLPKLRQLPAINDITTDPADPPQFVELAKRPAQRCQFADLPRRCGCNGAACSLSRFAAADSEPPGRRSPRPRRLGPAPSPDATDQRNTCRHGRRRLGIDRGN